MELGIGLALQTGLLTSNLTFVPLLQARSAYNLFFRDEQAKLRATKGRKGRRRRGASGGNDADNRVRIVADKWNNADDATKAYYFELASEDKTKYALEFAQWKQKQEEALSAHWDSKRPPSNRGTAKGKKKRWGDVRYGYHFVKSVLINHFCFVRADLKGNVAGNSMPVQDVPMQLPPAPHQVATTAHSESSFGFPTWQQGFHAGDELSSSSSQASAPEAGVFGSAAPKMPSDPSLRLQAQATSTIVNQGHLMTFHMQAASNDRFLPLHPETTASPDNDFLTDPQHLEELAKTLGKEGVDLMIRVFGNGEV